MELNNCIKQRRSIRKYAPCQIDKATIEEIVMAGQLAPSWKNSQTPRYYAVISEQGKKKLRSLLASFNAERTSGAGAFIVTTVKKGLSGCDSEGKYFSHLKNGFECFDNGLAVENMLLKAYELGYGSLIMGLYDEKAIREYLSVPENEDIVVVIALGKSDICPDMPERKDINEVLKVF